MPRVPTDVVSGDRSGYVDLAMEKSAIKPAINEHREFASFIDWMNNHFAAWREKNAAMLKGLKVGNHPRK